jgi:hypothetical protein
MEAPHRRRAVDERLRGLRRPGTVRVERRTADPL